MPSVPPAEAAVDADESPPFKSRVGSRVDEFAASPGFRVQVALLLAAVSLIGAFVSYTAAERAAEASHLTALASQQYSEEQQAEQQIQAILTQDARTVVRAEPEWRSYQDSLREADAIRVADPVRAAELDLIAQESFARYAQIYSFFRQDLPRQTVDTLVSAPDFVRAELEVWDPRLFRASSALTSADAHAAAAAANATVATVILLVGALLLLTLGHVTGGRRGVMFATTGALVALGGTIWFVVLNIGPAQWLFGFGAALVLIILVIRAPRVQASFAGLERHSSVVSTLASAVRADPMANAHPDGASAPSFERFVAVAIAAATLLGATAGFFQAQSSRTAEEEGWRAQDSGVQSIGALRGAEEDFALDLEAYEKAMVLHADSWSTEQAAAYAAYAGRSAEAAVLTTEAARREAAAQHQADRSTLIDTLGETGIVGRAELLPLYAEVWRDAAVLVGIQDAANSASQEWGARAGVYLSALSWLAVAVYLLGLSVTFRAPFARKVLMVVGLVLIVIAAGFVVNTALQRPPPAEDVVKDAAEAYAAGFVLAGSDPAAAAENLTQAVELRPDFGIASRDLAQAILDTGSVYASGFAADFTPSAVTKAIDALEAARENRADTAGVLLNLGAMLFHRAVQTDSQSDMERSLAETKRGLELGREFAETHSAHHFNEIIGRMNLALALAGTGQVDQAADEYRAVGEIIAGLAPYRRPALVSVALIPLDLLASAPKPPSGDEITALKELLVATAYGVGASSEAQLTDLQIELLPQIVQWRATISGFDPALDRLVVQWYRFDPDLRAWSTMPLLSGGLTLGTTTEAGQFQRIGLTDSYWGNSNRLIYDEPRSCVRPGTYRVEFYLNGRLQPSEDKDSTVEYVPQMAQDIGVSMCRPDGWSRTGEPGWSTGVQATDGSRGVVTLRLLQPRSGGAPGANERMAVDRALRMTTVGLPEGISTAATSEAEGASVIGFTPTWQLHDYPGGAARIAAAPLPDGSQIVVCVYGPQDWVMGEDAGSIVTSVSATDPLRYAYPN